MKMAITIQIPDVYENLDKMDIYNSLKESINFKLFKNKLDSYQNNEFILRYEFENELDVM